MLLNPVIRPVFSAEFRSVFDRRRSGGGLASLIAQIFGGGEQGLMTPPFSDFSKLWKDVARTSPVTAVGDVVAAIDDISGRGYLLVQSVAGSRMVLRQDGGGNYFLEADGVDAFYGTSATVNLTGTSKLTIWAAVRKESDAGTGAIVESGMNRTAAGCFGVRSPNAGIPNYDAGFTGSVGTATQNTNTTYAAPVTNVLSVQFDAAVLSYGGLGPIRINGAAVASTAAGAGVGTTGNFANQTLYMGAISTGGFPFSGRVYGLIVRGAVSNAAQISAGEAYLASLCGVML